MRASETLRAPAKLNLTLEVLAPRPDGLHGIRSVMVPVDVFDELHVRFAEGFSFSCDVPELQHDNLVVRAIRGLRLDDSNFGIDLHKRIPSSAGMGGGSSDAAAVLLAAQRGVFGATDAETDYLALARELGSDVPFFLAQTAALVEGTGERVTALGAVPPWHAVVVRPPVEVSTAWAYRQIDASSRESRSRSSSCSLQMAQALQRAEFGFVVALLHNDFDAIVRDCAPQVAAAAEMLRAAGSSHSLLSGSGSCVFALAQTAKERDQLAARIAAPEDYRIFACSFWSGQAWRSAA